MSLLLVGSDFNLVDWIKRECLVGVLHSSPVSSGSMPSSKLISLILVIGVRTPSCIPVK